ncbi:MAG: protoporphyrinogen/coproporphyrinogen oxidase [Actinomycetota bacterium]|nr:protoporphyrinogen/coproporphyrinogen oxidase [Actinomycetota bacterium]
MGGTRRVAVIGGGVSGLATAYHLVGGSDASQGAGDGHGVAVTVLEAGDRPGGKIDSATVGGVTVDTGPDALMIKAPAAAELVADLGLDDDLRPPSGRGAYLWSKGALRPLPPGSVFGVPDKLWPLLRSGLLGPWGFVRAGADLVLPRAPLSGDPTIEEILRPRFGTQVFDRLVEPLLGGVHAGRAGRLSARSAAGEVFSLAEGRRSLYLALRNRRTDQRPPASPPRPALMSLRGGLGRLVDGLVGVLGRTPSATVLTGATVTSIARHGGGYRITGDGFEPLDVDDVVLATPAWAAEKLLRPVAPSAADAVKGIPYVGVATVVLAYSPEAVGGVPSGTGFLVPPVERRLLVGCTWSTSKWPHLLEGRSPDAGDPPVVIRAMVGRDGDQAWSGMDDAVLVTAVRRELAASMGVHGEPDAVHVRRLPLAMPQYTVGHADRLRAADRALAEPPGLYLTGAGYRGVGLAACLAQAKNVAAAVRARVAEPVPAA